MNGNIIILREVTKIFERGESYLKALNRVSLEVCRGEFLSIMGTSGSGKTTLLNILSGLDTPTEGYVAVDGTCLTDLSEEERTVFRRKEIGFVFQKYNLLPSITVLENLLLPLKLLDMEIQREEVEMLAEKLGIREKLYQMPDTLSGGQQQRVAIARALLYRPPVILADEPTGSLDRRTGTAVLEQMRDMSRQYGQTLIVVTHDEKIAKMADRTICLEDGEVVKDERRQEGISAVGGETVEKSL